MTVPIILSLKQLSYELVPEAGSSQWFRNWKKGNKSYLEFENSAVHGTDDSKRAKAGDGATDLFLSLIDSPLFVSHSELLRSREPIPLLSGTARSSVFFQQTM